jgi:hypothetical protein
VTTIIARFPALAVGIVIALVMAGADLAGGESPAKAALSAVIVLGYAAIVTVLGRRSAVASALAGRPLDERWEHIGLEACALALGISGIVILAAFVITEATGGDWKPYALMAAVMGLSYFGALGFVRARH